ncbi:ribosome small subunit-dependent GTPase A [Desulfovibrio subterraneus]|uniref:Small ribosomal subunit biogenesis GTPase RsgA n=1 Tax=Desulfovibrio subterraneus TaxID=2718620 RepID=A0A7J0BGQ5_9BACT|nr:ribosome small subunit-dependent GTPase A [Desulfovibrio subterraneus]GFM32889.1 putative ribosome biogenesis GTPase RsgA [Desulfovibrio subterraneus]
MTSTNYPHLAELGWNDFFENQLDDERPAENAIVRVCSVHSMVLFVMGAEGKRQLAIPGNWLSSDPEDRPTVGDWLILDETGQWPVRILKRQTLVTRRAPSDITSVQLVAANLDTLFIVTSLNDDFNLSRLERYLAIAYEYGVTPVVVLSKRDLVTAEHAEDCAAQVRALHDGLDVVVVNALTIDTVNALFPWVEKGMTATLVGSSGVGKSTLVNTLSGEERTPTGAIRDSDSKGRHTTSSRTLYTLPNGGLIMDVPGFRELRLPSCEHGIAKVFADIIEIGLHCGFTDCLHDGEPDCAVEKAVEEGRITRRRVENYRKLLKEQAAQDDEKQQAKIYARQRRVADRVAGKTSGKKQRRRR